MGAPSVSRLIGVSTVTCGILSACSSFSAGTSGAADAGPSSSEDGGDGRDPTSDASDAGSPDPCAGQGPAFEYAGLYVVDGYVTDDSGTETARASVLRAPLRCDGSMGSFAEIGMPPPRALYWGNAVLLGGQPLVVDGLSDTNPTLVGFALLGTIGTDGMIDSYLSTNAVVDPLRWRAAAAATASHAYLLGGQDPSGSKIADVEMLTLTANGSSPMLDATHLTALPEPISRGSAAVAQGKLVIYGGTAPYWTALRSDGTYSDWAAALPSSAATSTQFDGVAAADDDNVYLIGGEANGTAFSWVDCTQSPPVVHPGNDTTLDLHYAVAATARGTIYFLPDGVATMSYAKLQTGALDLQTGSALPEARRSAAMFVF